VHPPKNRRSFLIIALNVAIVLLVAGGTAAYGAMSRSVTLTVEGESHTIRTFGSSVSDVLAARDVDVRPVDKVNLHPAHELSDGDDIEVAYAKPVTLSVDGDVSEHTVYETTVSDALDDLGVDVPSDAYMSKEPDTELSRQDNTVVVSTPKKLVVSADGEDHELETSVPTVGAALKEAGVSLGSADEIDASIFAFVEPDQKITVTRIEKKIEDQTVPVDFDTTVTEDADALKGEVEVVTPGEKGKNREKVELVYADGKLRDRTVLDREVLSEPVTQVESHGTKVPEPTSADNDTVWDKIAQCESGGNWSINTGNGYYGGLQFSAATWKSVGGPGLPHQNSREVQIKYAKILQKRSGWGQWGCAGARFN
jgi:uncharacterized protein YabE (DUF348 family)